MGKFICDFCGKEYIRVGSGKNSKKHFCSNECRYKAKRGKDVIYYEKDYAYILLTKNGVTKKVLFDIEDIEKVKQFKWHLHYHKKHDRYDACTNTYIENGKRKYIMLSRFLTNCPDDLTVDHINRNTLDNRRCNLRNVTIFVNNLNKSNNTSGCVGVTWDKNRQKWKVTIRNKFVGRFSDFQDAVIARKKAEQDYHLQNNN